MPSMTRTTPPRMTPPRTPPDPNIPSAKGGPPMTMSVPPLPQNYFDPMNPNYGDPTNPNYGDPTTPRGRMPSNADYLADSVVQKAFAQQKLAEQRLKEAHTASGNKDAIPDLEKDYLDKSAAYTQARFNLQQKMLGHTGAAPQARANPTAIPTNSASPTLGQNAPVAPTAQGSAPAAPRFPATGQTYEAEYNNTVAPSAPSTPSLPVSSGGKISYFQGNGPFPPPNAPAAPGHSTTGPTDRTENLPAYYKPNYPVTPATPQSADQGRAYQQYSNENLSARGDRMYPPDAASNPANYRTGPGGTAYNPPSAQAAAAAPVPAPAPAPLPGTQQFNQRMAYINAQGAQQQTDGLAMLQSNSVVASKLNGATGRFIHQLSNGAVIDADGTILHPPAAALTGNPNMPPAPQPRPSNTQPAASGMPAITQPTASTLTPGQYHAGGVVVRTGTHADGRDVAQLNDGRIVDSTGNPVQ